MPFFLTLRIKHVDSKSNDRTARASRPTLPASARLRPLSTHPEINVFLAARTGALLRWLLLAVLALRRTRRLAPHPVLFAKIHIYFRSSTLVVFPRVPLGEPGNSA